MNLVAGYAASEQSGGLSPLVASDNQRNAVIGLQLNVPLYAGGAIRLARARIASRGQRQAEQELSAARRDVRLQVQDAYLSVTTSVSRIASFQQSLVSARTALEATTLGRDVGTRTELDVLDVQQRAFAAELDLMQARFDYLLGRVRLAAAAGELGEDRPAGAQCLARVAMSSAARRSGWQPARPAVARAMLACAAALLLAACSTTRPWMNQPITATRRRRRALSYPPCSPAPGDTPSIIAAVTFRAAARAPRPSAWACSRSSRPRA